MGADDSSKVYWTILGPGSKTDYVRCRCVCGTEREVRHSALKRGQSKSCNCMKAKFVSKARKVHGMSRTPEHNVWWGMHQRCKDASQDSFPRYGGRGIRVCERWSGKDGFLNFYEDMGSRPSKKYSIERRNTDGNYEPSNCYWATGPEQGRNTSRNHNITFNGETKCLQDWADGLGMNNAALLYRIRKWGVERALTTPKDPRKGKRKRKRT